MTTLTPLAEVLAQEHLLQKYKERVERLSTVFHDERHPRVLTIYRTSDMS